MEHDYLKKKNETCLGILSSRLELAPSQGRPSGSQLCLHSKIKSLFSVSRQGRSNPRSHRVPKLSHVDLIQVEAEGKKFLSNKTFTTRCPKKWFQNSLEIKSDRDHKNGALSRKINRPVVSRIPDIWQGAGARMVG